MNDHEIRYLGRAGIIYKIRDKFVNINSEMLLGGSNSEKNILIWYNTIQYWITSHGKEIISDEERGEIVKDLENDIGGADKILWDKKEYSNWSGYFIQPSKIIDID